ncbi:hypothetical protein pb186bvf_011847 [Paramecium bursaria]
MSQIELAKVQKIFYSQSNQTVNPRFIFWPNSYNFLEAINKKKLVNNIALQSTRQKCIF